MKFYNLPTIFKQAARGFTIVEMMLYMGLFMMLLTVLTSMFVSILQVHVEAQSTSAIEQNGRYILNRISYDLYRANSVSVPANFGQTTDNIQMTVDGQTYVYAVSNNILQLTRSGTTERLHNPQIQVQSFSVTKIGVVSGTPTLQIDLTLEDLDPSNPVTREYTTTIGSRL